MSAEGIEMGAMVGLGIIRIPQPTRHATDESAAARSLSATPRCQSSLIPVHFWIHSRNQSNTSYHREATNSLLMERGFCVRHSRDSKTLIAAMCLYRNDRTDRARVLLPGAGLGRLALEIASKGYSAQGNEFSYQMLFASNFILNW